MNACDVLVMIWGMTGRDAQALIPVIYLLKTKYKLRVEVRSIFEYSAIDCLRPKVLLTNGCNGSSETFKATRYATSRGVYTVSLHAEGVFIEEDIESFIIGWNDTKEPTVNKWFVWGDNNYKLAIKHYPKFKNVLLISASTLHEKYQYYHDDGHLRKYLLANKYEHMVLYVAGAFDYDGPGAGIGNAEEQKKFIRDALIMLANNYPNCLLILKYHPATKDFSRTEIHNHFIDYNNVKVLKNEYSINKLIQACDIMLNYDSTTQVDAWLSDKPTICLYKNDNDGQKKHKGNYLLREGSLNPTKLKELLMVVDEYFKNGNIQEYDDKSQLRKEIIKNSLGDVFSKPSMQIARHINDNLNHKKRSIEKMNIFYFMRGVLSKILYRFPSIPGIMGLTGMRNHYNPKGFQGEYDEYKPHLEKYFYQ